MTGTGGAADSQGTAVPGWVGQFLRNPDREDVLRKLQRSDAAERHAFIFDVLGGAPWPVEYYLNFTEGLDQLPTEAPNLPQPVTGVWIVGEYGQKGLRWDGSAWRRFEARGEGIEGPSQGSGEDGRAGRRRTLSTGFAAARPLFTKLPILRILGNAIAGNKGIYG